MASYLEFRKLSSIESSTDRVSANAKFLLASSWHPPRKGLAEVRES